MNENDDRPLAIAFKEIDRVARAFAILDGTRRMAPAIGGGVPRPAGHHRRVLGNPRPVVVFGLVVDAGQGDLKPFFAQTSARKPWSWRAAASIRGRPSAKVRKRCAQSRSRARPPSCETRRGRPWSA